MIRLNQFNVNLIEIYAKRYLYCGIVLWEYLSDISYRMEKMWAKYYFISARNAIDLYLTNK